MAGVENIRVLGFFQKFPPNKRDDKGNPVSEDWVQYGPATAITTNNTRCRVSDFIVPEGKEMRGPKAKMMAARWSVIEPKYEAWKKGHEIPEDGTPLAAWPGVTSDQAEAMRRVGIRTVEDVRDMTDSTLSKVHIPGVRDLKKQASIFLSNTEKSATTKRISDLEDKLAAAMELLEAKTRPAPQSQPDDEVETLRAQLDAKGIQYHHKAGPAKLREMLDEAA